MSNGQNINITSNNQMGGVTAHTVNFGPTARNMDDNLGNQLKATIPLEAEVTVTSVLGDGEAYGFANQVLTWLKNNGFTNVSGVNQAVYFGPVIGQNVNKVNDNKFDIIIGSRVQ
jgi:hypothetical protein